MRRVRGLTDLPILYDHQKAGPDMPDMAKKFTALCAEAEVDGLILFPVAGPAAVDGFVGEALKAGIAPVVGGEIPVADYGVSGGGYLLDNALDLILARAAEGGADHFVLPAHDTAKVTRWSRWIAANVKDPLVFLTGFGSLGGTIEGVRRRRCLPAPLRHRRPPHHRAKDPAAAAAALYEKMQALETAAS